MASPVNDRDVLLLGLGASQRSGNPPDAAIILSSDAAAFRVMTNSVAFPSAITITANLVSLVGTVVFSATNATVTDNHDNTTTLNYASMTGDSATITARITVNGQAYTKSLLLSKVYDGAKGNDGAKGADGATGSQYATAYLYQWYPAGQVPSKPTGSSGYTWASGVNSAYGASDGWTTSVPTNPGTPGLLLYVAAVAINAPGGTASTVVSYGSASVQAWAQNGNNGGAGVNAITGLLTNESITLAATNAGVVSDFTQAVGTFKVFDGNVDKTGASSTYSVSSQTGCTVTINAAGAYSVTAMSADNASATLQAVYGGVTLQKTLTLAKARAGANGQTGTAAYVVVSTTSQVFSRANAASVFAPTSTILTATPYGGTATYQWQYWTGAAWTNVATAGTASTYTVASGDFTDTRTYRVQATIGGVVYTDEMTLAQVTGGTNGNPGTNAIQSATIMVYQWAATIPSAPVGTASYRWSDGTFGAAPTSPSVWNLSPGTSASQGMTLWAAKLYVTDSAANATTAINWTNSAVVAVGYSGQNGQASAAGASYVTAYTASATGTAVGAPATTTGKTSLPAANSSGLGSTWSKTVPTLVAGQYLYQTDGIYDPTTDNVIWSIPYWSSLKVGSLSAISANLGAITAGSIDINNGTARIGADGAAVFKSIVIGDPANPVLTANGTGSVPTAITQAGKTADYGSVANRPQDGNNLVAKGTFDDGSAGLWGGGAGVVAVAGQTFTKALQYAIRDTTENVGFPVAPGETLFFEGWLDATGCNFGTAFGLYFVKADGTYFTWVPAIGVTNAQGAVFQKGSMVVPSPSAGGQPPVKAYPWLQIANDPVNNPTITGSCRAAQLKISRFQSGATVGATLGVNVTGTATNAKDIATNLGTFVSPGTARTQINDLGIQVFDGSNRLRIKIGQL